MKNNYRLKNFSLIAFGLFFAQAIAQPFTNGIFVLNEGGAGSNNSDVSFISNAGVLQNNIFGTANASANMGDTGQSIGFNGDLAYVVLNISNEIRVVNAETFELETTISNGLTNPRYIAFADGKAYVTCWGNAALATDDYVAVIDLDTNEVASTIPLAEGVERILKVGNKLYVAHQGGYGFGNTVSVIDIASEAVSTITVGDVPNSLFESNGTLYVLCGGIPSWSSDESDGRLVTINLSDNTILNEIDFVGKHPSNFELNDGFIYYTNDTEIYKMPVVDTELPTEALFSIGAAGSYGVYAMDIIDNKIYVGDALDYVSPGKAYVYSTDGNLLDEFTVGTSPNGFYKAATSELGLADNVSKKISLYPNPTTNLFYISSDATPEIKIYDMSGRLVKSQIYATSGISVSDLNIGIYSVEISESNQKQIQRLIVK